MLLDKAIKEIEFELNEIDTLLELYKNELFELNREPNLVELTALAGVLHSFYSGIERIFIIIAKNTDKKLPSDLNWHKALLMQMATENKHRQAVISLETKEMLSEYLVFRHFYRHSYSFRLKWKELKNLIIPIQQNWEEIKSEILSFIEMKLG